MEGINTKWSSNSPVTFRKQAWSDKCCRSQKTTGPRCQ